MAEPGRADLDPGLGRPYQVQVVLHLAENRFLTPIFRAQLERELGDHLRLSFGPLAQVEIVRQHPLLPEVLVRGLQQALDGWEELSETQTHFLLLDFVAGRYELQGRQHDGLTGLNSPVIRREVTSDRRLVVRLAAQLIERDFGLVGTVEGGGPDVRLALRGGALEGPLGRWAKPGEVFAVVRINQAGDKQRGARLPWALLQVLEEPRAGHCRCRYFHRYQEDRLGPAPAGSGFRALRLGTIAAPVRLRFIDDRTFEPLVGLQVHVCPEGFSSRARELTTDQAGQVSTKEAFAHAAFVRVLSGSTVLAQFPVELGDEQTVVCRLRVGPQADAQQALEFRKDLWLRRIYDNLLVMGERVAELNLLLGKSLARAQAAGRQALQNLDEELAHLTLERDQLLAQAALLKLPPARFDHREADQRLEELHNRRKDLDRFLARLEQAIREAGSEKTRAWLQVLERARLLESQHDFDQAIAFYEKFLEANPDQPRVAQHLQKLKACWQIQGPAHGQAREFVYKVWPGLDAASLKTRLGEARQAFETCCHHGDVLTPRKLLQANIVHAAGLSKRLAALKRQDTEDNRAEARAIAQVAAALMQLHQQAQAFVKGEKGKAR